ncbi:MAG: AAA family ATPase [Lactimicrobium sp.]|jgi:predicted AAA+ superfamily ATPase|uniref:ATP-binding protein n=1 Tax=Lactimicrobium sp. TaxID=2563780 RepID=UPI002F359470
MYLTRKIDQFLKDWKADPQHKPLIVKGARQTGKRWAIRHFARENYESFIEINFVRESSYKVITEEGYSADSIIKVISRIDPFKRFIPGKTLIFFDELQDFPDIATSLKFFNEDKRFDVICSGSMLGINYHKIESNSVGNKTDYEMKSMDFEEFLWAKGYRQDFVNELLDHLENHIPFANGLHEHYLSLFLDYCVLGGMPAVVSEYIERGTFEKTLTTQRQILLDYEEDIRKYASGLEQTRIMNVFRSVPSQLAKENKKFQISKVAKGATLEDYDGVFDWLKDAGAVNICYCMRFPELPIKGNIDRSKFKVYFADTGLLVAELDDEAQQDLRVNRNLGVYKGALYENIVAECLAKQGYELCYYKRQDGTLEEDFFVRDMSSLIPVEVKARKGHSKSLRTLIDNIDKYPDVHYGLKITSGNIGAADNIVTVPYYCAFLLKQAMPHLFK